MEHPKRLADGEVELLDRGDCATRRRRGA